MTVCGQALFWRCNMRKEARYAVRMLIVVRVIRLRLRDGVRTSIALMAAHEHFNAVRCGVMREISHRHAHDLRIAVRGAKTCDYFPDIGVCCFLT